MKTQVEINKDIYTWAIARAGYSLPDFAKKYPRVFEWVEQTKKPTVKQLEAFSKSVHLPFGYLFLNEPPKEEIPFPFFRTNRHQVAQVSVNIYDTILLVKQRQDWLREYLINNEYKRLEYVGKFKEATDADAIVTDIRNTLDFNMNWASNFKSFEETIEYLTAKLESIGIFLVFNGVVENSTRRNISVEECRGFVLVDNIAPFMFINNGDAKAAQLFTIVHELAHIWIGISAGFDNNHMLPANNSAEILCDKVAAEFLVPRNLLTVFFKNTASIKAAALYFRVSELVIARRALDLSFITRDEFFTFYNEYMDRVANKKANQTGGGDFYLTAKKRIGLAFAAYVNRAVKTGELLHRDAYRLTGLKGTTYDEFIKRYF